MWFSELKDVLTGLPRKFQSTTPVNIKYIFLLFMFIFEEVKRRRCMSEVIAYEGDISCRPRSQSTGSSTKYGHIVYDYVYGYIILKKFRNIKRLF